MRNPYIQLMRPKHWLKNALVLMPLLFSGGLLDPVLALRGAAAFVAFSLAASAVYVVNDLNDVEKDRAHPTKRNRPIASGAVSIPAARALAAGLLAAAAPCHALIGAPPAALLAAYVALNVAYSRGLKSVPILDVVILAAGYLARLYYGALACGVQVSGWLYLTVLAGSFYLGLGKRRGEIDRAGTGTGSRDVLGRYPRSFLDKNMHIYMGLTVAFYALWAREQGELMLWTAMLVMVIFMRYSFDVEGASDADPMGVVASDRAILVLGALYIVAAAVIIYSPSILA